MKNETNPAHAHASTTAAAPTASSPIEKPEDRFPWLLTVGRDKAVSANAARVALLLTLQYFSRRKMLAFPSQEKLSEDTDLGVSTIRRAIKDLMNAGYLKSYKAFGSSNRYTFCLPIRSELSGLEERHKGTANPLNIERSIRSELSGQSAQNRAPNHMNEPCEGALSARPSDSYRVTSYGSGDDEGKNTIASGAPDARLKETPGTQSDRSTASESEDETKEDWPFPWDKSPQFDEEGNIMEVQDEDEE